MAEKRLELVEVKEEKKNHFLEFFQNLQSNILQFFFKRESNGSGVEGSKQENCKSVEVSNPRQDFSSLKLSVDNTGGEQEKSSTLLWQVYALGGFMIASWMWARWKESQANNTDDKPVSGDEEPTLKDD